MKQNSSILFHPMRKLLINRYLRTMPALACIVTSAMAAEPPAFDPAKGFKPAQRDLTAIYLQIAESLKQYGSPLPYLRHVKAESQRVAAEYKRATGREGDTYFPGYMNDAYLAKLSTNWDVLAPKLGLEPMAKEIGGLMVNAINGSWGTGTILVDIFNKHQKAIYESMPIEKPVEFEVLQKELTARLKLESKSVDMRGADSTERDAVDFTGGILGNVHGLYKRLDAGLPVEQAGQIKSFIDQIFVDVGRAADAEFKIGIIERAIQNQE